MLLHVSYCYSIRHVSYCYGIKQEDKVTSVFGDISIDGLRHQPRSIKEVDELRSKIWDAAKAMNSSFKVEDVVIIAWVCVP